MVAIRIEDIEKSFGAKRILHKVRAHIENTDKIGIIGQNGTGKTTLLKLVAGLEDCDSGSIWVNPQLTLGYLPQNHQLDSDDTIWHEMLSVFNPVLEMEREIRQLEQKISITDPLNNKKEYKVYTENYTHVVEVFEEMGGYRYNSDIRGVLNGLGFSENQFHQRVYTLSGGEKTRMALAKVLLLKPSILLLDEPTNYLDIEALNWLEGYLKEYKGCILAVSHDRFFLDNLCNKIFELENNELIEYPGNYSNYILLKKQRFAQLSKAYTKQQTEIKRQQEIIKKFRSFNREKSIRAAESREKQLIKMELVKKPPEVSTISLELPYIDHGSKEVIYTKKLSMDFDGKVLFSGLSFNIFKGDKVGLVGPNGIGKSTLFKILSGKLSPRSGSIEFGHGIIINCFEQELGLLDENKTILDEVWQADIKASQSKIRNILSALLFKEDDVYKPISGLSGGEKSRVYLAKLMLTPSNFLMLDEPTNHLDLWSKEQLEKSLVAYFGTLLVISHDRYFLNKVCNKIFELSKEGIQEFLGNYDYYMEKKKSGNCCPNTIEPRVKTKTRLKEERKREREERIQRRRQQESIKAIEEAIEQKEVLLKELHNLMCREEVYSNPYKAKEINQQYAKTQQQLKLLYEKWEEKIQ